MRVSTAAKARLELHVCVVLWGFTPIFGRVITLDALALVWWRMLIVAVALLALRGVRRELWNLSLRLVGGYALTGWLLAMTWLLFYASVKMANASVAAVCLAVAPVFLAAIEPWLIGRPLIPRELLLGLAVIPGVALVVGGIPSGMYVGLAAGLASSAFVAAFNTRNKHMIQYASPLTVLCIEMGVGAGFLTLVAPLVPHTGAALPLPGWNDAWLLLLLSLGCTLIPFVLLLKAMREVSAFETQIATNLETLYAIILAIPLLGEQHEVGPLFYLGVVVIVGAVVVYPLLSRRHRASDIAM